MSKKTRVSDGKSLGDGRTEGDGGRQAGDDGGSGLKQEGSKGGSERGMKDHSPFVTFRSGPSGTTQTKVDNTSGHPAAKDSRLSYKDKLMCLGESGLLEPHFSAAKALSGWKDYFAKTNETQGSKEMEGDDEEVELEEEAVDVWRRTGKLPNLHVSAEEYDAWCKPFRNSLIVKLLGKTINVGFMRFRMERMWAAKGPLRVTPLSNGYFLVSFSSTEDRDHALQEGPWMIADHYVLVQRWRPNFNPWKADHQKRVAVWVRIPDLPHELYNVESIRRIGNMIGKTLKIDRTTAFSEKGGFARMCVEVDLQKPLLPGFSHFGEERRFKYEGLHLVCFTCGRYGHRMDQCTITTQSKEPVNSSSEAPSVATTAPENPPVKGVNEMGNSDDNDKCVNYGPQMLVKREFGNNAGKVEGKGSNPALAKNKAGKGVEGVNAPINVGDLVDQKGVLNGKKIGDVEAGLCNFGIIIQNRNEKQEWIQVGAKRKAGAKIKARGKENKMERIKPQSGGKGNEIGMKREINESKSKALMVNGG